MLLYHNLIFCAKCYKIEAVFECYRQNKDLFSGGLANQYNISYNIYMTCQYNYKKESGI
ncbi:hypothetical protein CLOSTASPAR_04123 [[Clostridium] asparagiforme DSM 15981]|uniref:Uncharacterized protein n=1 Tax=[Clostridium] asparagiforme DSM 15981 TaxID=518636 RepID=C0D4C9_9FIRM|nr:hypothetical protein CLOSTASPAR_04123 [[Clostridium] asparagiforme DSM 15981]